MKQWLSLLFASFLIYLSVASIAKGWAAEEAVSNIAPEKLCPMPNAEWIKVICK
jgi:hypothetical protein